MFEPDAIDAVLFDAGGVLILPSPDALRQALAPLGVTPDDERCRAAHYAGTRELDRLAVSDWRAVDRAVALELGVPADRLETALDPIGTVYTEHPWVAIPDAGSSLAAIGLAGYTLGVVSNAFGTIEEVLAGHRICSTDGAAHARVEVVIDSALVGVEKPNAAIFHLALDAIGVAPERAAYVGDTVHFDVNGAQATGLHPVHIDPYGRCDIGGHAHARSVAELARALRPRTQA